MKLRKSRVDKHDTKSTGVAMSLVDDLVSVDVQCHR